MRNIYAVALHQTLVHVGMCLCQVIEGCLQACETFKAFSRGAQGGLEHEVALLHIQANLIDIAESVPGNAATRESLAVAKGGQQLPSQPCIL